MVKKETQKKPKEEKSESFQEKVSETFESITKSEKVEGVVKFAKKNTADTIAYALLFVGLILLVLLPFWGGFLIGLVGGVYFSEEVWKFVMGLNAYIEKKGLTRAVILGGVAFAFLITSFSIFLGAALAVVTKQLLLSIPHSK